MAATIRVDFLGDATSAKRAARETSSATDKLGRDVERSSGRVGKLGTAFGGAVKAYGPLAAIAGAGLVLKLGSDSIKAASDVEQAFGGLDAVFGKQSSTVKQWAADAAESVGLAKSDYASLASTLGASLKNSGIEDYADKTRDLIGLGSDLAATFGGKTADAVAAVSSLLRGETDPIERYGVSIKQADVNARLAAEGLGKLEGKAKTQAEQQIRLALLFEQTADAQGSFARESDTLAGSQERLSAKWENMQATLGEKLLPIGTQIVSWLSDTIDGSNGTAEVLERLGGIIGDYFTPVLEALSDGWKTINEKLDDATGKSDSLSKGFETLLGWGEDLAPVLGDIMAVSIGLLVGAIVTAIWMGKRLADVFDAIGDAADWVADRVDDMSDSLAKVSSNKIAQVFDAFTKGTIVGLFREDPAWSGGLGRDFGGSVFGGGGGSAYYGPQQIVLQNILDGEVLDERTFKVATRAADQVVTRRAVAARRG